MAINNLNNNFLKKLFSRFLVYTLVIFSITLSLPIVIEYGDVSVFAENGPIEWLQVALLFLSATVLLFDIFLKDSDFKQVFWILVLLQLSAASREMDSILDRFIPVLGWKLFVFLCILSIFIMCWKCEDALYSQVIAFARTRAFTLLWCGFIVAVPYSQLVGHSKFLELLMGDDYIRDYKRVIEELGEFLGYLFIMIGSLEAILQQREL